MELIRRAQRAADMRFIGDEIESGMIQRVISYSNPVGGLELMVADLVLCGARDDKWNRGMVGKGRDWESKDWKGESWQTED